MTDSQKPIDDDADLDAEPELVKDLDVEEDDAAGLRAGSGGLSHNLPRKGVA